MAKRQHAVKRSGEKSSDGARPLARVSRTPVGDAFSMVAFLVLRLGGLLTVAGDALAAPAGQTSARWQVLAGAEHAPATVAQIARALGLARQSVQRVADILESEGLATYQDNPEDARAKLLCLTPRGRAALATIQKAQRAWADELGAQIGETDLRQAGDVLRRVATVLAERSAEPLGNTRRGGE